MNVYSLSHSGGVVGGNIIVAECDIVAARKLIEGKLRASGITDGEYNLDETHELYTDTAQVIHFNDGEI